MSDFVYWDGPLPYIAPEDEQEKLVVLYDRVYAARDHQGLDNETGECE